MTARTFEFNVTADQIVTRIRRAVDAVVAVYVNHTLDVPASAQPFLTNLIFPARRRSGSAGARHEIARLHAITKNPIIAMRMDGAFAVVTDSRCRHADLALRTYDRRVAAKQINARIFRAALSVIALGVGFARNWGIGYAI